MLQEIAIVALAILNQLSLINAEDNRNVFLSQFIGFGDVPGAADISADQDIWRGVVLPEKEFEVLPTLTKSVSLDLNAVSAYAIDAGTDYTLYDKNSKKRMPIASITKVMTAVVVLENKPLDDTVTISPRAMGTFGDKKGMVTGEKIRLEDLLKVMLIDSNNAAAVALAEHTGGSVEGFVAKMNEKGQVLGLKDTRFFNPTGLDEAGEDNYSTAHDLAQLADYALERDLIWSITRMQSATLYSTDKKQKHYVTNTDELLGKMDNIYGGKTGYTVEAGQCLLLITETADKKHKVISAVLNAEDRFAEMKRLNEWIFDVYRW